MLLSRLPRHWRARGSLGRSGELERAPVQRVLLVGRARRSRACAAHRRRGTRNRRSDADANAASNCGRAASRIARTNSARGRAPGARARAAPLFVVGQLGQAVASAASKRPCRPSARATWVSRIVARQLRRSESAAAVNRRSERRGIVVVPQRIDRRLVVPARSGHRTSLRAGRRRRRRGSSARRARSGT